MWGMISRRAPRDGDPPRTPRLPDSCRIIGAQLTAAREARQLSVEALASQLLLSKGQILGLEHGDPAPFYNQTFFLRGLRKYMAFAGLPPDLLHEEDEEEENGGLRLMLAETFRGNSPQTESHQRAWQAAAASLVLVLGVGTTWLTVRAGWFAASDSDSDRVALVTRSPIPAQPIALSAESPLPVRALPASAVLAEDPDAATVRVSVGKPTWVFIRYPDNRVVQRRLAAGEDLEVGPLPVYLALGTADSVELRVENKPVALGPYIRDGQVRLTRPELARLLP